jgi:hypothetical protein
MGRVDSRLPTHAQPAGSPVGKRTSCRWHPYADSHCNGCSRVSWDTGALRSLVGRGIVRSYSGRVRLARTTIRLNCVLRKPIYLSDAHQRGEKAVSVPYTIFYNHNTYMPCTTIFLTRAGW